MRERFQHLERLTAALADAVTADDAARVALTELLSVKSVTRVGLALSRGAGRELSFVSTDDDALSTNGVRWCTIDGLADVPLAHTVRVGTPVYLSSVEDLQREYPEIAPRQLRLGTRSLTSIPLIVDGASVGGLLVSYSAPQDYSPDQRAFLDAFAAQISQALRRGLAYQMQRSTSEELPRSLMPHSLPELAGLSLGAHYQPGGVDVDVGGDWYDVMPLADGSAVVCLGDVMGKGLPAAVVMSEVRAATRAYALLDPEPSLVLQRLDRMVSTLPAADQVVTMVYGLVDPARSSIRLAVAGHPPPLLVESSGRPAVIDGEFGAALGLGIGPWHTHTVRLENGLSVLFYSDGLVETRDRDLFTGIALLQDAVENLSSRRRNPRELCARVSRMTGAGDARDDVTALAVTASPPQPTAVKNLPAHASAAALARRFITTVLHTWGVDGDVVETAKLCVSELVTNAIIHSGSTSTLTVRTDSEYLLMMVHDQGSAGKVHRSKDADLEAIAGRGLSLVDALASAWDVEQNSDGTLVWCELALNPRIPAETSSAVTISD